MKRNRSVVALVGFAPLLGLMTARTDAAGQAADASPPPVQAMNAFYYYSDVDRAWAFYTELLGFETVADYGFAKILRVAPLSYLTLVDAARGMHSADEPKTATLAIVTEQVEVVEVWQSASRHV